MSAFSRRPLSLFASLSRTRCTECAGTALVWTSAVDLAWGVAPGERIRVFELIRFCGEEADAWRCETCGAWGVFGSGDA